MKNRYRNLIFCDRLIRLYQLKGIDTNGKHWASSVASEMLLDKQYFDVKDFQKDPIEHEKGVKRQIQNIATTLKRHINTPSTDYIGGDWLYIYCDYFDCSSDYLMGLSENITPVHESLTAAGLTDRAAKGLLDAQKWNKQNKKDVADILPTINYLLEGLTVQKSGIYYVRLFFCGLARYLHPARLSGSVKDESTGETVSSTALQTAIKQNTINHALTWLDEYTQNA